MHLLPVPPDIYAALEGKKPFRVKVTLPGEVHWKAAVMSNGAGSGWIGVSKKMVKTHHLPLGVPMPVKLEPDTDQETWPLPEEMVEVLALDDEAQKYFNKLTEGKKRSITVYINQTNQPQRRVERALLIAENLKRYKGKGSAMQLLSKPS